MLAAASGAAEPFTPFTAAEHFPAYANLPQEQAALLMRPVLKWQADAEEWLDSQEPCEPKAAFRMLRRGAAIKAQGREAAGEFLARLSDADLGATFDWSRADNPEGMDAPESRLLLADAVLSRQTMTQRRADALIEKGRMLVVLGRGRAQAVEAFASVIETPSATGGQKERAAGYLEAMDSARTPAGFSAANDLIELATRYKRREAGTFSANRTLQAARVVGTAGLFNGANTGSLEAARAATRACFELADKDLALAIGDQVAERVQTNPELAAEALYYAAMCLYAEDEHELAIPLFQRVIDLTPESPFAGAALLRIGGSHVHRARYGEAVIAFDDVRLGYPGEAELVEAANKHIDFLITSGFLSRLEVHEALLLSSRRRTTAMAVPQPAAAGGAK